MDCGMSGFPILHHLPELTSPKGVNIYKDYFQWKLEGENTLCGSWISRIRDWTAGGPVAPDEEEAALENDAKSWA